MLGKIWSVVAITIIERKVEKMKAKLGKEILLGIFLFWFMLCQDFSIYNMYEMMMIPNVPIVLMLFLIWRQNNK